MVILISLFAVTEGLDFPDWVTFLQWKEKEEKVTHTYYTKPKGSRTIDDGETHRQQLVAQSCKSNHTEGIIIIIQKNRNIQQYNTLHMLSKTTNQRRQLKPGGTVDACCISRMMIKKGKGGSVSVRYTQTHKSYSWPRRTETCTSTTIG